MGRDAEHLADLASAVRESTLKRLHLVPSGRDDWRLTPESMSFADVVIHLIEADEWLFRKMAEPSLAPMVGRAHATSVFGPEQFTSLCHRLEEIGRRRAAVIRSLSTERLEAIIPDARFPGPSTRWWIIVRGNIEHEVHHRGQIVAWLRAAGISRDDGPNVRQSPGGLTGDI